MDYQAALKYMEGVSWLGSRPGLGRISELLERLGRPQDAIKAVHVAGTNGKGSVSALLRCALTASGLKTGLYISPHLLRENERMSIDGEDISDTDFARAVTAIAAAAEGRAVTATIGGRPAKLRLDITPRQRDILLAGGLLNYTRENMEA